MSENVIIFGAGASADARIPLMGSFVETMWEMAVRGKIRSEKLKRGDHDLMLEAMKIRDTLDNYHGRVYFDDRNLEDILSILSFNAMAGGTSPQKKLSTFVKAISRTIELTCVVQHNGKLKYQGGCPSEYVDLWNGLVMRIGRKTSSLPTIITFNHDLVLERSLYIFCQSKNPDNLPIEGLSLMYHYDKLRRLDLSKTRAEFIYPNGESRSGTWLEIKDCGNPVELEILKLHGSVNFPRSVVAEGAPIVPLFTIENPLILPPIFSKMDYGRGLKDVWGKALQRLREAKNIIIVGYSLPVTDIYMQYFLKAGLGPNINLYRVFVFDPVLFETGALAQAMIQRYRTCFSPQMEGRIVFNPPGHPTALGGTLRHFVNRLDDVLF